MSFITSEITRRLREAGIDPKKSLGQNFLVNEGIYQKIIEAAQIEPDDTVIEVGPGLGILTDKIADLCKKLIAVEKDSRLIEYLKNRYRDYPHVEIIEGDILKFNPADCEPEIKKYKLIGNIPYYLTSHLIRNILESWPQPELVIFTVQKEVSQRIIAVPPDMNLLSVAVQFYAKATIEAKISKGSFYPPPKVDSSIIKLVTKAPRPENILAENFFKIVRAGFASKRRQLGNNLSANLKLPKEAIATKLLTIDVAPQRRAETLTLEEWQKITKIFS